VDREPKGRAKRVRVIRRSLSSSRYFDLNRLLIEFTCSDVHFYYAGFFVKGLVVSRIRTPIIPTRDQRHQSSSDGQCK